MKMNKKKQTKLQINCQLSVTTAKMMSAVVEAWSRATTSAKTWLGACGPGHDDQ